MTSPTNRCKRNSANASCGRIDFIPSRRAAFAGCLWLALAISSTLVARIPWFIRVTLAAVLLMGGISVIRRFVLLRGPRAVRALDWRGPPDAPTYEVVLGSARRLSAAPRGCRRYGAGLWMLGFQTEEGLVDLLVDSGCQEPGSLRALSRRLFRAGNDESGHRGVSGGGELIPSRPKV